MTAAGKDPSPQETAEPSLGWNYTEYLLSEILSVGTMAGLWERDSFLQAEDNEHPVP